MKKKLWVALSALISSLCILLILYFIYFAGKSEPFTLIINNQSPHTIHGKITFLDEEIEVPPLKSGQTITKAMDLRGIRIRSKLKDQIGKIAFEYKVGKQENQVEIFGYVEPGDPFLYGKQADLTFDPSGKPKVTFDFEQND